MVTDPENGAANPLCGGTIIHNTRPAMITTGYDWYIMLSSLADRPVPCEEGERVGLLDVDSFACGKPWNALEKADAELEPKR